MTFPKFRQEAYKEIASTEQYQEVVRLISPQAWIILLALWFLLLILLIWGFFGSIPIWVEGQGILLAFGFRDLACGRRDAAHARPVHVGSAGG